MKSLAMLATKNSSNRHSNLKMQESHKAHKRYTNLALEKTLNGK